jgi:hypothetical protein
MGGTKNGILKGELEYHRQDVKRQIYKNRQHILGVIIYSIQVGILKPYKLKKAK